MNRWICTAIMLASAAPADADLIPSWRLNTISPGQAPPGAVSVSLIGSLTGSTTFDSAGLFLSGAQFPGIEFVDPTTVAFPVRGPFDPNFPPSIGENGLFNAVWGPTTPSGLGIIELARLTMLNVQIGSSDVPGFVRSGDMQTIPLPPIPIAAIPEPCIGALVLALVPLKRQQVARCRGSVSHSADQEISTDTACNAREDGRRRGY